MSIQITLQVTREEAIERLINEDFESLKSSFIGVMRSKYDKLSNKDLAGMLEEQFYSYEVTQ